MTDPDDPAHEAVMDATAAALAANGYAGLTMAAVADRCDVAKSTLHYRYDTKEGLLTAWLEHTAAANAALFERFADAPPLERLLGILGPNLDAIEDPTREGPIPAYLELHTRAAHTPAFRAAIREGERRYRAAASGSSRPSRSTPSCAARRSTTSSRWPPTRG